MNMYCIFLERKSIFKYNVLASYSGIKM